MYIALYITQCQLLYFNTFLSNERIIAKASASWVGAGIA